MRKLTRARLLLTLLTARLCSLVLFSCFIFAVGLQWPKHLATPWGLTIFILVVKPLLSINKLKMLLVVDYNTRSTRCGPEESNYAFKKPFSSRYIVICSAIELGELHSPFFICITSCDKSSLNISIRNTVRY